MIVFPDVLGDVRAWLRAHPDLTPLVNGRVFFRIPETASFPLIRIYQAGGAVQPGDAPVQDVRLAFDIWGSGKQYAQTTQAKLAVESACHRLPVPCRLGTTQVGNAQVTSALFLPDPQTGDPRWVVDALFTVRLTGPGDAA